MTTTTHDLASQIVAPCFGEHYMLKRDGVWACDNPGCDHKRDNAGIPIEG